MRRAYVSMICGGDAYVPGIEALGRSLVESGSRESRVLMVTPDVSPAARERLAGQGWLVRPVESVGHPDVGEPIFKRFDLSFTKLRVFSLVELDKAVFLDADTVVLRNVDELFERPAFAAAPDFFMPDRFNSGVMVLEPSQALTDELLAALARLPSYDGGDQGLLNSYWSDWWAMPVEHRLGPSYNMHHFVFQFMAAHPALRAQFLDTVKIVHYTLQKPWLNLTVTGGADVWWQKFYGAHPEQAAPWRQRLHQLEDWSFDAVVGALGGT